MDLMVYVIVKFFVEWCVGIFESGVYYMMVCGMMIWYEFVEVIFIGVRCVFL